MARGEKGHYSEKHPAHYRPEPQVVEALRKKAKQGSLSCAVAFAVAKELDVPPGDAGLAMDSIDLRITKCQMGLFGYSPEKRIVKAAEKVSPELQSAIEGSLLDGRLPCSKAWGLAKRLSIGKMAVAAACEALHIKISKCQLGAF